MRLLKLLKGLFRKREFSKTLRAGATKTGQQSAGKALTLLDLSEVQLDAQPRWC